VEEIAPDSREYVAHHEAAHVAACIATRRAFIDVAIVVDPQPGQPAGYVQHRVRSPEDLSVRELIDSTFITLVAISYDSYRYGAVNALPYRSDIGSAVYYLTLLKKALPNEAKTIEGKLQRRAYRFVRKPLHQGRIEKVAQALLVNNTLTYRQVLALLGKNKE
jgi:hypothetical protein